MAHQFDTGFVVRKPAWHGLAAVLADYPSSTEEARRLAGLDWDPIEADVFALGELTPEMAIAGTESYAPVEGYKLIKRSDTGHTLSIMQSSYTTVSNARVFEITEALLEAGRQAGIKVNYETAGSLDAGRRVWALAHMPERHLPGDPSPHLPYLFVATSHDGTAALRAGATCVRVVCANTEKMADQDMSKRGSVYEFRHTKGINAQIEEAKQALAGAVAQVDSVFDRAKELIGRKITAEQRKVFVADYALKVTIENMGGQKGIAKRSARTRREVDTLLTDPKVLARVNATAGELEALLQSETCAGISGTAYGLVQAAVEFEDWIRDARSAETRFNRNVLAASGMKRYAHSLVDEVTATV